MNTAVENYEKVRDTANAVKTQEPRVLSGAASCGDWARQGDVYLVKLPRVPRNAVRVGNPQAQVAPGNTKGSRHRIRDLSTVTVYGHPNPNALQGPVIDAPNGFVLDHGAHAEDDHAPIVCGPGVYAVTYQRQYADELRRVAD